MSRVPGFVLLIVLAAGGCGGGAPITTGPSPCAAWNCDRPASAPLAWTRPGGGEPGALDVSRSGDLCELHAAKTPFVLAGRFVLVFGVVPALAFGYIAFRVLYIFDRHGPGLARFGEAGGRRILFGVPLLVVAGWLAFFAARAW